MRKHYTDSPYAIVRKRTIDELLGACQEFMIHNPEYTPAGGIAYGDDWWAQAFYVPAEDEYESEAD